ncbi:MAG: restriction endonuclease subunit S [Verrucomicrobiota bacterium]|nr:restriction endonuclease subunit S [Verrucomicrobiota bacterium]
MSWPREHLAGCCEIITKGTTPMSFGMPYTDSGIPFLRVQNIRDGGVLLDGDTLFVSQDTHKFFARSSIQRGDVLLSIAGTIGRSAIVPASAPPEMNCNQAVAVIRLRHQLEKRFLLHWLNTRDALSQMTGGVVTGTISNLSLTQVRNLGIPLPPLAEQRRIAEVLDRAEALRAKRRAALDQLDSLTQSLFLDFFGDPATNPKGWPQITLGDALAAIRNGANAMQSTEGNGWPITRIETISDATINPQRVRWIEPDDSLLADFRLQPGDILFSHINSVEHIGKTALYSGEPALLIHGINLLRLRPKLDSVEPVWLLHLLKHDVIRTHFRTRCKRAVNQASLNQPDIKSLKTFLPPIKLQREFARRVTAVERLKTAHRASLAELDALFATLQHRAFRGEL